MAQDVERVGVISLEMREGLAVACGLSVGAPEVVPHQFDRVYKKRRKGVEIGFSEE